MQKAKVQLSVVCASSVCCAHALFANICIVNHTGSDCHSMSVSIALVYVNAVSTFCSTSGMHVCLWVLIDEVYNNR